MHHLPKFGPVRISQGSAASVTKRPCSSEGSFLATTVNSKDLSLAPNVSNNVHHSFMQDLCYGFNLPILSVTAPTAASIFPLTFGSFAWNDVESLGSSFVNGMKSGDPSM